PDICRLVGNNPHFARAFREMGTKLIELQLSRLHVIMMGHHTDAVDKDMAVLMKEWEVFVDSISAATAGKENDAKVTSDVDKEES
ncbi:hypothetical protein H0H93_005269, partial [Arthromyces matolae]